MDSDDICELDRFERQLNVIEANSEIVVSGWIEEFNETPKDKGVIRKTPTNYQKIISWKVEKPNKSRDINVYEKSI